MKKNTIKPTLEELEQIELILTEANAYGLRAEVEEWADSYQEKDPNISRLDAVIMAYSEWVK
jgi:hypothetical protein